jgi:hypothetical protein
MRDEGKKNNEVDQQPSLFDAFQLGDRVIRTFQDKYGKKTEFKGIILKIDKRGVEIYWDTQNGKYNYSEKENFFTYCNPEEIFYGNNEYSSIKKEKNLF